MATNSQSTFYQRSNELTIYQRSNQVNDYICNACEDQKKVDTSADFYCEKCDRFYCGNCNIDPHVKDLAKHTAYGRVDIDKWPVSKQMIDFIQTCEVHTNYKLDKFCNQHRELCCPECVSVQHSQCNGVTPISDLTSTVSNDLPALSVELKNVLEQCKSLQTSQEASVKSLHKTFKEHERTKIQQLSHNIINSVNECHTPDEMKMCMSIISLLDDFDSTCSMVNELPEMQMKEKMCMSIISLLDDFDNSMVNELREMEKKMCMRIFSLLNDFDNSTVNELREMQDEVISIKQSITSSFNNCTLVRNDLTQFNAFIQKIGNDRELCFLACKKCEQKIQQALIVLGKSDNVLTVIEESKHNVRISSDIQETCGITNICVLPTGQVLVADWWNNNVKLLNQQYQVVSHCGVAAHAEDMCLITPIKVAVTVNDDKNNTHEVQFVTVNNSQLVSGRKLQFQHRCISTAHHQGDLFVTSGTALYMYTLGGKLVSELYVDRSKKDSVYKCAVSPTGDKLYITNHWQHKLVTLARDGTPLACFLDRQLGHLDGIHVTPAGQVLVCADWAHFIIQVDSDGRKKLMTEHRGWSPESACYNSETSSIIVGQWNNNNILVLKVQ